MTVRFFILQAHYRSTIDFSNEALQAAEKGLQKLIKAIATLKNLKPSAESTVDIKSLRARCYEAMDDDLNSPVLLSYLFEGVKYINSVNDGTEKLTAGDLELMGDIFRTFVFDILGLTDEATGTGDEKLTGELVNIIIGLRQEAKDRKEWSTSDRIREDLRKAGIVLRDVKNGVEWEKE
jgi:cysteinyl-tRNA synthetase